MWVVGNDGRPSPVTVQVGDSDDNCTQLITGPLAEGQPLIVGITTSPEAAWSSGLRLGF